MKSLLSALLLLTLTVSLCPAVDEPTAGTVYEVSGKVLKADAKSVSLQTRRPDGKFGEAIVLQFTDTTRVTLLRLTSVPPVKGDPKGPEKVIVAQREATVKDFEKDQVVSVIYSSNVQAGGKDANVLLSAVIQPARNK